MIGFRRSKVPYHKFFFSLLLIFAGSFFVFLIWFLRVNEIECLSADNKCPEAVSEALRDKKGNFFLISLVNTRRMLDGYGGIADFSISYIFPSKILVKIKENIPRFRFDTSQESVWVDDKANIVSAVSDFRGIAVLADKRSIVEGQKLSDEAAFVVSLLSRVERIIVIEYVRMSDSFLQIRSDRINYIFPLSGDVEYLSGALNLLVLRLNNPTEETTIEKSEVLEVDFRYKYPVIRTIRTVDY